MDTNTTIKVIASLADGDDIAVSVTANTDLLVEKHKDTLLFQLITSLFPKDPYLFDDVELNYNDTNGIANTLKLLHNVACDFEDSVNAFGGNKLI